MYKGWALSHSKDSYSANLSVKLCKGLMPGCLKKSRQLSLLRLQFMSNCNLRFIVFVSPIPFHTVTP